MKNQLNKLNLPKDESNASDIESRSKPIPPLGPNPHLHQYLVHLLTIALIITAILFPLAINGASTSANQLPLLPEAHIDSQTGAMGLTDGADSASGSADTEPAMTKEAAALAEIKYPRVPVDSSDIVSVGYNPETKNLFVEFKGGRVYKYSGVPAEIHDKLMKANSHGRFFNRKVKDKGYKATQLQKDVD